MADALAELVPKVQNIFEFLSVHREMIYDDVRTSAYAQAISRAVRQDDIVVDVGTGTGLLALLAVRAGAKKVYAIEKTGIIEVAKANAKKLGVSDKIEFIREDSRDAKLPEKADVIVSEVIGHLVVEENMLDSLLDARDRFLKPGGKLIPSSASMHFAPVEAHDLYESEIGVWGTEVQGVDMSESQEFAVNNLYIGEFAEENYLAQPKSSFHLNLRAITSVEMNFKASYSIARDGLFHGVAGWFIARLYETVRISTAPTSPKTHWRQCFFPVKLPVHVNAGDRISFEFASKTLGDDVVIDWQILAGGAEVAQQCLGISRSTAQNERSFSLKKLWLNAAENAETESLNRAITLMTLT